LKPAESCVAPAAVAGPAAWKAGVPPMLGSPTTMMYFAPAAWSRAICAISAFAVVVMMPGSDEAGIVPAPAPCRDWITSFAPAQIA
jgi:hypothetical protein